MVEVSNFKKYAEVFRFSEQKEDEELVRELIEMGLSTLDAEHFIAFVPVAFGRTIFELSSHLNIVVPNHYLIYEDSQKYTLTNQPVYNIAYKIASENKKIIY